MKNKREIIEKVKTTLSDEPKTAVGKHLAGNSKIYVRVALIVVAVILVSMGIVGIASNTNPYAITVDGENACFVRGKSAAKKTIQEIVEKYVPKGMELKAADTDGQLSYKKANAESSEILSTSDAAQYIIDKYQKGNNSIKITIASTKVVEKPYTPEPNYEKSKKMLAGESKVKKKGEDGTQEVTITYISVNGKIKKHSVTGTKVIDEGKKATVLKGILGLPKGKDWKTYTGSPVYKDGKELVTTAKRYMGAPYRYGGTSLKYGIDCVAYVVQMYAKYGIKLPSSHSGLQHSGVAVSYKNAKKGDLICYNHHVGIYVGNGKMINATSRGGVKINRVKVGRLKAVRRMIEKD